MDNWTEKYRPRHLGEIIGNHDALVTLKKWGEGWQRGHPSKKALILSGRPGVGKTSAAHALAQDFGWEVVELNASDDRNEAVIKKIAFTGGVNETFTGDGEYVSSKKGRRKLIILDEADNLYDAPRGTSGEGDRGGKRAIIETIKKTQQPLLLIVNDYYSLVRGAAELRYLTTQVFFPGDGDPTRLLQKICQQEGVTVTPGVIRTLVDRSQGDTRAAINDLQSLCQGQESVDTGALTRVTPRDRNLEIFQGLREILKSRDIKRARNAASALGETPEFLLLWLDENLHREYRDDQDLAEGYTYLSKADIFLGRARKRQHYHLWTYATDLMSGGVAVAKKRFYPGFVKYGFPLWLTEMKQSLGTRHTRDSIAQKIGAHCHFSTEKGREAIPLLHILFTHNEEFATLMTTQLALNEDEVSFLTENDTATIQGAKDTDTMRRKTPVRHDESHRVTPQKKTAQQSLPPG